MKVSVIVPVYNAETYLKDCLNSLIKQTLKDIEIICVDNCSTDGSLEILKKYADLDERIRIIKQRKNKGQCNSLIKGLNVATGEYIAECDSDDIAGADMYEKLYHMAKKFDCDVVQCGFVNFSVDNMEPRPIATKPIVFNIKDLDGRDRMQFIGNQPHIMSAIYKRSFLMDNGIWYRDGKDFEDTSLSFKIRTTANVYGMIPECLYFYRKDNPGSGTFNIKKIDGVYEQFKEIVRWNALYKLNLDAEIGVWRYYTYKWASAYVPKDQIENFLLQSHKDFSKDMVYSGYFLNEKDYEDYQAIRMLSTSPRVD